MVIKEIYFDMDGVFVNFNKRWKELFNSLPLENYPTISNNAKKRQMKENFKTFVETDNFATMEPMPDFPLAISFINKLGNKYKLYMLSSTATEEYAKEISRQKLIWLKKYDINIPPIFVPGARFKQLYSGTGKLAIDDKLLTITQWNSKGGVGIHHKNWKTTINAIQVYLN